MTAQPVITRLVDLYDVPALADGQTVVSESGVLVTRDLPAGAIARLQDASDLSGTPATGKGWVRGSDGSMVWTDLALGGSLPALAAVPGYADPVLANVIIGALAASQTTAHGNTALGVGWRGGLPQGGSLNLVTTGYDNTVVGAGALISLTEGHGNTVLGADALGSVTTGTNNVGIGAQSGETITTGANNVGVGGGSNQLVSTGSSNVAVGVNTLTTLTTGTANVSVGEASLQAATTATKNVTVGHQAGYTATPANATVVGANNVFVGHQSGPIHAFDPSDAVAIGYQALADYNAIAIGSGSVAHGNGAVAIGRDHTGAAVSTSVQDQIALGTASHHILLKTAAAPADASLAASQFTLWLTDTIGGAKLNIKAKDSAGTVVTAQVALA